MAAGMIADGHQPLPCRMTDMSLLQIVRDFGHTDHLPTDITQHQFLRQALAAPAAIVEMYFQSVVQGHTLAQRP